MATIKHTSGEIIATEVSWEDYMQRYAADFHEWLAGIVLKKPPITLHHDEITYYLRVLFETYFSQRPIGKVVSAPFVMWLDKLRTCREPDLQIILNANLDRLTDTYTHGPADICIEVVSPESAAVDYGEKFAEYEQAGVREYWIIDPVRAEYHFHRLEKDGLYAHYTTIGANYSTLLLPELNVNVVQFGFPEPLPDADAISQYVQSVLTPKEPEPYPGIKLPDDEAIAVINRFRAKYHLGPAEHVISPEQLPKVRERHAEKPPIAYMPTDIAEFRRKHYGDTLNRFSLTTAMMICSWIHFPPTSVGVTERILYHRDFQKYETLYFSVWSTGSAVYKATPGQIQQFFEKRPSWQEQDYYIFDDTLKWCIAVTHDSVFILGGDFKVF